jgi:hypothetical protein
MNEKRFSVLYEEQLDSDIWQTTDPHDLWVMDKLIVSKLAGHVCGPRGSKVPVPGRYMVKPVINSFGMGLMARIEHVSGYAETIHPSEFWCEIFEGRHISVDYEKGKQVLAVEGIKHDGMPFQRFSMWVRVEDEIPIPDFLDEIAVRHRFVNCEFIGGKLIEIHLRRNPDFQWGNSVMIPAWVDESRPKSAEGMEFKPDKPNCPSERIGCYVA